VLAVEGMKTDTKSCACINRLASQGNW